MKIEKINENQIRFTLTQDDLAARQLRLSELAYGTEKARDLFREMLQQAADLVGFEADNTPLMIEAVPMRDGEIVLIVTKVNDPEELDPRFSNFAPSVSQKKSGPSAFEQLLQSLTGHLNPSDDIPVNASESDGTSDAAQAASRSSSRITQQEAMRQFREYAICNRLYSFSSMEQVMDAASRIQPSYTGESALYGKSGEYQLFLKMKDVQEAASLRHVLAAISEFSDMQPVTYAREQYLEEHGNVLIADHAIEKLATMR